MTNSIELMQRCLTEMCEIGSPLIKFRRNNPRDREQVAEKLTMRPEHISERIRKRARNPLPLVEFGKAGRFLAADIEAWILRQLQGRPA
jgi:hypothetical protein